MKAILAVDVKYKDRIPWADADSLVLSKGSVVDVIPADNLPYGNGIEFWIDVPELRDDPYGMGLFDGEYELLDGVSPRAISDLEKLHIATIMENPLLTKHYTGSLRNEIDRLRDIADKIERCIS